MSRRSDQVFQLSLTEIAFTISFILLLLLGYLVFKEQGARREAENALAAVNSSERVTAALTEARQRLNEALAGAGASNPSEVITRLVEATASRDERDQLRRQVEDLNAKLTALSEIQRSLEAVAPGERDRTAREAVASALALESQLKKVLADTLSAHPSPAASGSRPATAGETQAEEVRLVKEALEASAALRTAFKETFGSDSVSVEEVRDAVRDAKSYRQLAKAGVNVESVKKENVDLRGQVAFLKNRLRGGRDFPPCWADESGKVEFLFSIELRPSGVAISRAWPDKRAADAATLPGLSEALSKPHPHADFPGKVHGILEWSRRQNPECRHYVQLKSIIADAVQSDRARLMVESYFYKVEVRR